jgi:lysophospholipase L1-like esterase
MREKRTLFLGSSIIKRWKTSKIFTNSLNLGIEGLTSRELQKEYTQISSLKNYKNIILYIGSNDITHHLTTSPIEIYTNITEFISSQFQFSQNQNQNIIFVAILKSPNRTEIENKQIDFINRKMREFSQKHPNIHFCNVNRELSSTNNYLSDKIHLSEKGYSILSNHILSFL